MPAKSVRWLSLLLLFLCLGPAVQAQGVNTISYGSTVNGTLNAQTPVALYLFTGAPGDLVTARVFMLIPGVNPTLGLLGPTQQSLATGEVDVFGGSGLRLSARLRDAGPHTLIVGGAQGDYLLTLDGQPITSDPPLSLGQPVQIVIPLEGASQFYSVDSSVGSPLSVQVASGGSGFVASLHSPEGRLLATIGSGVDAACLTIPANVGRYTVVVSSPTPTAEARFSLTLTTSACAPGAVSSGPQAPVATEAIIFSGGGTGSGQSTSCVARSSTNVNIRSGPGQQYGILGTLFAGMDITVTGRTNDGWYQVSGNGIPQGWVASSVASLSGNCEGIPTVQGPAQGNPPPVVNPTQPPPQGQGILTATATQPDQLQVQPTYTLTPLADQAAPTATYAYTYTPTYTPTTPVQEAPPDSNYALNVPLDGNLALGDYVSYPGGDVEDVVSYGVTGLNPNVAFSGGQANLTITVACSGTGAQYITIIADGQTFSCGQAVVTRVVNADSNTGAVRIRATAGENTYVQWTLIASAPRVN